MKIMKAQGDKFLGAILILCLIFSIPQVARAKQASITIREAIDLALRQNISHSLYVWEQTLAEQREVLEKRPQITTNLAPLAVHNGTFAGPEGGINIAMPLGEHFDLNGNVTFKLDDKKLKAESEASLSLDYDFFAPPAKRQTVFSREEKLKSQVNSLVLQVVDLLIQLRQGLDLQSLEKARLEYLEASLEAAHQTPNFDVLPLRKQLREQVAKLASIQDELDHLQLRLSTLLGIPEGTNYEPILEPQQLELSLAEAELREELLSSSPVLGELQAELNHAHESLKLEQKTKGWDLKTRGEINLDLEWSVAVSASKTLYPRAIVLQELEFAVAKAEQALDQGESALVEELRRTLQTVKSTEKSVELAEAQLTEVQDDLSLRQREFQAGLVTEFQVKETHLSLQQAEHNYFHAQLNYVRSILELWNLCGRDLPAHIVELIS